MSLLVNRLKRLRVGAVKPCSEGASGETKFLGERNLWFSWHPSTVEPSVDEPWGGECREALFETARPPIVEGEHHWDAFAMRFGQGIVIRIHPSRTDDGRGVDPIEKLLQALPVVLILGVKRAMVRGGELEWSLRVGGPMHDVYGGHVWMLPQGVGTGQEIPGKF